MRWVVATLVALAAQPTWMGTYMFEEALPGMGRQTVMTVRQDLTAEVDVDGYQILQRLRCKAVAKGNDLAVSFVADGPDVYVPSRYKPGTLLFTVQRKGKKLVTRWAAMKPELGPRADTNGGFQRQ